jgi:hypothetical protein
MKKNHPAFFLSLWLLASLNMITHAQSADAAIRLTSGGKLIYEDPFIIRDAFEDVYFQKKDEIQSRIGSFIKTRFAGARDISTYLCRNPSLDVIEENRKIKLRYTLAQNSIFYRVARPDGVGLNNSSIYDPSISFWFDIAVDFEVGANGIIDDLRSRKGMWNCSVGKIEVVGGNVDPEMIELNKISIKSVFPVMVLDQLSSLMEINGKLNEILASKIQKNDKLAQEMSIDEDRKIEITAAPAGNLFIINHPYSSTGIVRRSAEQNPSGIGSTSNASNVTNPKTTTSASEINKKPAVSTPAKSIYKVRSGF